MADYRQVLAQLFPEATRTYDAISSNPSQMLNTLLGNLTGGAYSPESKRLRDESQSVMPQMRDPAQAQIAQNMMMGMGSGGIAGHVPMAAGMINPFKAIKDFRQSWRESDPKVIAEKFADRDRFFKTYLAASDVAGKDMVNLTDIAENFDLPGGRHPTYAEMTEFLNKKYLTPKAEK